MPRHAGSLDLVHRTLQGIAARSEDDGAEGCGRHAATIRLGKALWQSAPLTNEERSVARERFFDDGTFPPLKDALEAARRAHSNHDEIPRPFSGATDAYACYSVQDYEQRLSKWMADLAQEDDTLNTQQWAVIERVKARLLQEVHQST